MYRTRLWIAALLIAAFTVVPVLDAMACGVDALHSAEAVDPAKVPAPGDGGDHALGVCSHNHCHHFGSALTGGAPLAAIPVPVQRVVGDPLGLPVSHAGDGPMRPPRV